MKEAIKKTNIYQNIGLIGIIGTYILILFNIKLMNNLFFMFFGIFLVGMVLFVQKWSNEGMTPFRKLDKDKTKKLTKNTSDYIFMVLVSFGILFAFLFTIDTLLPTFNDGNSLYFDLTVCSIVYHVVIVLAVERTSREVINIEENRFNRKVGK